MDPLDAIGFVRKKRRGALNTKQLRWLEAYKPTRRGGQECCAIC